MSAIQTPARFHLPAGTPLVSAPLRTLLRDHARETPLKCSARPTQILRLADERRR